MKRTNKIILIIMIIAIIIIGIAYAAIQNIILNISSHAIAQPDQGNFLVKFIGVPQVSDGTKVSAAITNDTNATINVIGLATKGEKVTATYTIKNASAALSADLSVMTINNNTEYFMISSELAKNTLIAQETTTVLVTVELIKSVISNSANAIIGVQLKAVPVQPGEEGTSGTTNNFSQTPILITNEHIGDYIDLGNNIINTESTADDWRILYSDGNNIYAILADYLPVNQIPQEVELDTNPEDYSYNVWSNISRDRLFYGLYFSYDWEIFANGIPRAYAEGTPDAELLMMSYNVKSGTNLDYKAAPTLDSSIEDYDLYVPHSATFNNCTGYWLLTQDSDISENLWNIDSRGNVNSTTYQYNELGIRPIVSIPYSSNIEQIDGIWKVKTITNANIGEYINLENNIINTESTTDDWRILYSDGDNVYAILADYLPADQIPQEVELDTNPEDYSYNVWSTTSGYNLLKELNYNNDWDCFANGISATDTRGTPDAELLIKSYNAKNGTNLDYKVAQTLDSSTEDYDLYVPHSTTFNNCTGYWLATEDPDISDNLWNIDSNGNINSTSYQNNELGIRPIVGIKTSTDFELLNGVWEPKTITYANIGDYIDLKIDLIGTNSSKDDWRILYSDRNNIYAILADYLPAEKLPQELGLDTNPTSYPYSVWSEIDKNTLLYGLTDYYTRSTAENEWYYVDWGTNAETLIKSYNVKNGANLNFSEITIFDSNTEDYDLYVPHQDIYQNCGGYWVYSKDHNFLGSMFYDGVMEEVYYNDNHIGVRPVIQIDFSEIILDVVDGVWEIVERIFYPC